MAAWNRSLVVARRHVGSAHKHETTVPGGPSSTASADILVEDKSYAFIKRALDILVAGIALVLFSPVILALVILVKLDSPGPVIFCQHRLGCYGRPFRFYKFRTMRADARTAFPELYAYQYDPAKLDRVYMQTKGDPRVTRLGRILRRTSLDELPNLWNVLKGDMSMVGPRPEIPEMFPYYKSGHKFSVLPGATGLAQVNGRGKLSFLETLHWDEEYIRNRSLWYDLLILARTPLAIIKLNHTVGH